EAQLNSKIQEIYSRTVLNPQFQRVVKVALTMFIVFYGIGIVAGLVNPTPYDFAMRIVKLSVIVALTSVNIIGGVPGGWIFFSQYAVTFFTTLTGFLSTTFTNAFTPTVSLPAGVVCPGTVGGVCSGPATVFKTLDEILGRMFSLRFWRIFWAAVGSPWN